MGWGWVEYAFAFVASLFGIIGLLIGMLWSNLNDKIKAIAEDILERVINLNKEMEKHSSEINDNRVDITAIQNMLSERKEDNNRRFTEVNNSINTLRTETLGSLARIEAKIDNSLTRIESKLDNFRERRD